MGQVATQMLLSRLRGEEVVQQFTIGAELRLRRSTGG
jgi:DNA-binding LacI/PurR family transcriptional regulator